MGVFRSFLALLLVASMQIVFLGCVRAEALGDQSDNLFIFQQKLASRGNAQAQYAVGFMYEMGRGTEVDKGKAIKWYKQAAAQHNRAAKMRLTYLHVKEKGYQNKLNNKWLREVESGASADKPAAMFLLGELYHEGLGVKRDLNKSAKIMYRLSADGYSAAEAEMRILEIEIKQNSADKVKRNQRLALARSNSANKLEKIKIDKKEILGHKEKQAASAKKVNLKSVKNIVSNETKSQKRKNYEAVMRKLAKEQAQIDQLQGWSEGNKKVKGSADNEL